MQSVPDYALSVSEDLKARTLSGELMADPAQMAVAARLDRVLLQLKERKPAKKSSALGWIFARHRAPQTKIMGLYVHGSVGRGKTMLMDLFFRMAPVEKKRRAHFHEFMADVHNRIHIHRQKLKNGETKQADPVPPVAEQLAAEAGLLCFDEFTVTDIADAMILSRLFTELFARGCILVATSNVEPDNLYPDGLNRGLFVPFIGLLKQYVEILSLDSPTDYRLEKADQLPIYLSPADAIADREMDRAWKMMTAGRLEKPLDIEMKGRLLPVRRAVGKMARFTFAELCEQPLGASDYLALADRFHTIFIDHIPYLGPEKRNQTKRFIILIDALYDHHVRVHASAAAEPEALLTARKGTEGFEFDRTASRLFEMRSREYLEAHTGRIAEM
ncbi:MULTISPECIES: cell division protein ZapE [Rhizobium/Agrobacterium group]|uniref:cell division protein ZapE n=1 Tax=Rhizobium/Agrobacterium group TaxID=227290 RepID=UPI000B3FA104|nr:MULTISPECIES: cell division protein ZapE [Rhizobium/Agrobacterium group]MCF1484255.1 AFG1 family ATPase [Allorhizobium ampelinum]NSZ44113.1 cell division protein ZapE [Agrobacterium vitis]NTA27861.1 cell division protein ZapE [Allorhizobium ampelinum]OVE93592.1 cell division protein ZapE [Allorhizobium ampelinum]